MFLRLGRIWDNLDSAYSSKPMMFGTFIFSAVVAQVTPPSVTFDKGAFKVSGGLGQEVVSIDGLKGKTDVVDRSKGRFKLSSAGKVVTFDSAGLTISEKGRSAVSKMAGVPTSGKIATKESNQVLMQMVADKERKLEVSALSGWELIDKTLYMLFRWEDTAKKPWLEALMKIDLTEKKPLARLVGCFEGLSFANARVEDVLIRRADKLALLSNKGETFGVSKFSLDGKTSTFDSLGVSVGKAKFNDDDATAWTLTPTDYGTNIIGVADLDQSGYHVVSEIRGKMIGVSAPGYARYKTAVGLRMVNLLTGAQMDVQPESGQRQTANGLLMWAPATNPKTATLFDPSFRKLAEWTAPVEPVVIVLPPKMPPLVAKAVAKPIVPMKQVKAPVKKSKKPKFEVAITSRPSKKRG